MMTLLLHMVLTWLGLASFAFAFAVLLFRLPAFAPPTLLVLQNDRVFSPGIWRLFITALGLLAVTSVGDLLLRATEANTTSFPQLLPALSTLLLRTDYGNVWLVRLACLLLLFLLAEMKRQRDASHGRYFMFLLSIMIAWTESAAGHAAENGHFALKEMMLSVHLLAVSAWGGGVIALAFVILPFFKRQADIIRIVAITRRFSHLAGYAVGFVLLTAVYNLRMYVGEFAGLWKTTYGLTVLAKMLILYILLLLGALNRYLSLPLLEHVAGGRFEGRGPILQLINRVLAGVRGHISLYAISIYRRMVTAEAVLILIALLCAALLKHQTPARQADPVKQESQVQAGAGLAMPRVPELSFPEAK
jgi:putative copper export protein